MVDDNVIRKSETQAPDTRRAEQETGGWDSRSRWSAAAARIPRSSSRASHVARACCRSMSWCCSTRRPSGWPSWRVSPAGCWRVPGRRCASPRPRTRMQPSTAPPSCSSSCASAASRRGSWTRRCPCRFDCVGQETTGPGGFAKALRTVPVVLELAELVQRRAAPDAWLVDFTNPVGIVTQALLDRGHRAIGLCNVAINFQRGLPLRLGVDPERVFLDHVGLNHLTWIRAVVVDGVDHLPRLLDGRPRGHPGRAAHRAHAHPGRHPLLLPALLLRQPPGHRGERPATRVARRR